MQFIDKNIENYAVSKSTQPSSICQKLAEYTHKNTELPQMLTGPMEMSFMGFLLRSLGTKRVLEIGTFTGYSALSMAENLPEDGEVVTLDIDQATTTIAQQFWNESQHGSKITSLLGPALESIAKLEGEFDLVFIDADKSNYLNYLKAVLPKLTKGGVVVVDNVLWSGKVLDRDRADASTKAIIELNDFVAQSNTLYGTLLPIRDGMFLIKPLS